MFQRVVVPVDLTDRTASCDMAARLVGPSGGTVYLLHVIEPIPGFSLEEERPFYQRLEGAATKHLAELARPLRERNVSVREEVVYGPRGRTIMEESARLEADLVVVESHRVEPSREGQGLGTLSHQIGLFARCSVLLVK